MPRLREGGMVAVSANGVLGDPTGATAAEGGAQIFGVLVHTVTKALARWEPGPPDGSSGGNRAPMGAPMTRTGVLELPRADFRHAHATNFRHALPALSDPHTID